MKNFNVILLIIVGVNLSFIMSNCGTMQSNYGSFKMIPKQIVNDNIFLENSTEMKIKYKKSKGIKKYKFGDYRVVKGSKSKKKKSFKGFPFKKKRVESKKQSKSFVLVRNDIDTLMLSSVNEVLESYEFVNGKVSFNPFSEDIIDITHEVDVKEAKKTLQATYIDKRNNEQWILDIVEPKIVHGERNSDFDGHTRYNAVLKNDKTIIEIDKIGQDEHTKRDIYTGGRSSGFEFYLDNHLIAAVNLFPTNNRSLWVINDLDKGVEMAIAATTILMCESFPLGF